MQYKQAIVIFNALLLLGCNTGNIKANPTSDTVAHVGTIYCGVTSSISIDVQPISIDSMTYDASDFNTAEGWIEFNFEELNTTYFWEGSDGLKSSTTEKLTKINSQLYYARVDEPSYIGYTSYLFDETGVHGILTEDGYVSTFICKNISREEIEKTYDFSFTPYLN